MMPGVHPKSLAGTVATNATLASRWMPCLRLAVVACLLPAACTSTRVGPSPTPPLPTPAPTVTPTPAATPVVVARPTEGRVTSGSVGLWYHITGRGSDTVLVPLGAYLGEAFAPLAASHTVVFFDPRHRGRSDAYSDTTLSTFDNDVGDVEAVRRELAIGRAAVVGFSYFAGVAVAYAARYPERVTRLVLLSPIEPTETLERAYDPAERVTRIDTTKARALLKLRAAGRDTTDPAGYCAAYWQLNAPLFVGDVTHASRISPTWCEYPNESPRSLSRHLFHANASLGSARDFTAAAARVGVPVLVVQGTRDLVVNPAGAAAWARILPQARVWSVPNAGHFVFAEDRDAVVRAVDRFLRGEWP